ncbi:MAG TPA: septum formation initiator family protein [Ktedonobacteraceae bacterium]|nr:septum formation initiator family protein [Ktedonobacteraceae bacterium]
MTDGTSRPSGQLRSEGKTPYVTSAIGIEEPAGRTRARRVSLFARTVIWVTGLICLAFLLGSLAQAWSNNQLMQRLLHEQQVTQQLQQQHSNLTQQANHYNDPYVIESEARQQLGYSRPGEHVVVVVGAGNQSRAQKSVASQKPASQGFWQAWWNLFFGNG